MKDLKISKELLNAVLGHNDTCNERIIQNKLLYMCKNDGMIDYEYEYNIYEFAFKCKDWALSKGYFIYSTHELSFIKSFSLEIIETFANGKDTEIECIIKACNWILEKEVQEENILQLQEDLTEYNKLIKGGL